MTAAAGPPPADAGIDAPREPAPAAAPRTRLHFTGEGREYFRIWVVNLLLTLATLGAYSAWAKVRKARYFYQNTRLDGHVFDYHGAPLAILRGRLIALVLLAAYTWSFDISRTVGLVTIAVLCLGGPWLFMKAQQFKFRNSSWRGLRFGFDADLGAAYRTLLPLLLVWFSGTIVSAVLAPATAFLGMIGLASGLLLPWMHHALKRYQHARISYGNVGATFRPAVRRFYSIYFKGALLLAVSAMLAAWLAFGLSALIGAVRGALGLEGQTNAHAAGFVTGGVAGLIAYLGIWPYFAARLQQVVWGNTRLGPVAFETHMRAWPLMLLVVRCVVLTLATCGLYWPFAAVALARYRIESVEVLAPAALNEAAAAVTVPANAAGEGAADLFGLDVGL
jgi:uncharacterized membrane protein YjgN (DUF898 family)